MKNFGLILVCLVSSLAYSLGAQAQLSLKPTSTCDYSLEYDYYEVCYSEDHFQAFWTFHKLTKESINGNQKRTNNFKRDYRLLDPIGSRDYRGSGFDRGHLVPAGDMKLNHTSMSESFYMTNMSPQISAFNSGVWRALESGIRKEVLKRGDAFVVTAPILNSLINYDRIWSSVSIPDEYYKIVYFPEDQSMIAFLIPNKSQKGHKYTEFRVTVDELEALTGFDFFSELPDELEEMLESEII